MANQKLFTSITARPPQATARNEAGGPAYQREPRHALAQFAATGCFNGTFYADGATQLGTLRSLITQVDDNVFLAKLAVYSRERAFMKDMPAALDATLPNREPAVVQHVVALAADVAPAAFRWVRAVAEARAPLDAWLLAPLVRCKALKGHCTATD
ncbi:MAG: hypothetical protein ACK5TO_19580, partial [Planctomycetaceae bacterium]